MNETFDDLIDKGVVIYLDDIMIYAETLDRLRELTKLVLQRLSDNSLYAKPQKCEFEVQETTFVGIKVSDQGTEMDFEKTAQVKNWPTPQKVRD